MWVLLTNRSKFQQKFTWVFQKFDKNQAWVILRLTVTFFGRLGQHIKMLVFKNCFEYPIENKKWQNWKNLDVGLDIGHPFFFFKWLQFDFKDTSNLTKSSCSKYYDDNFLIFDYYYWFLG